MVVFGVALAYIARPFQIQSGFITDPVGSKTFPILIGAVAVICGLVMIWKPDDEPDWPGLGAFLNIAVSILVMVGFTYALKPLGFLIPGAICTAILSYQISQKPVAAILSGIGLSIGLFLLFRFALRLETLQALPKDWLG
ncbi:MAG: tripartite tricarboxylate transporter TctB family protein [Pseudomonadota bacterium]